MNASLSDGNEPVIDIFILSANTSLSAQLEKQLRDEGYYVTLFTEGSHLLETLRNGKPNMLMCDTTVPDADAFEVCRQIKADDYLWNIPVLIISGASDLGDLLRVLDCNADNFIAHPFDPPYLLSLIEGMLTTPVERQTAEQIKTQFKIKHDDQVFVVTADRRKLLEFLLSSFEIAVNKSSDLSRALDDKEHLGTTIRKLEETVLENTKVIGIINENLKSKEQKLSELTASLTDREESVREKTETIERLSLDLSNEKTALADAQSEIDRVRREKDESQAAHQATIDQLQRQVTGQSSELDTLKPALEHANAELLRESGQRKEIEEELSVTRTSKEQAEKALAALTTEYEQLKITFGTEKNRADEAENECAAVLQAKNESEQDLTKIINDLKNTARDQAAALTRFREESAAEISGLKQELESRNARLRQTEENLTALTAAKAQADENLTALTEAKAKAETTLRATIDERQSLQARLDDKERAAADLERELASVSGRLEEANAALVAGEQKIASQKEDLVRVYEEKEKAESLSESLSASLNEIRAELEQEKSRAGDHKERMKTLIMERDRELSELRTAHEDTRTALSSHTTTLEQMKRDLESAQSDKAELEGKLQRAEEKILQIGRELENSTEGRAEEEQKLSAFAGELEQAKSSLEHETFRRQELEDQLREAQSRQQHAEQDLEKLESEIRILHADLSAERRSHDETKRQNRSLEDQVSALGQQKTVAEKTAADLTAEIDQARTALADEWEDHMTDHERLLEATKKVQKPAPLQYPGVKREAEIIKKRSLIVKVPTIPPEIRPLPRSMVAIDPVRAQEPYTSPIKSVEDLYEDDDNDREKQHEAPRVSIVQEPDTEPVRDVLPDPVSGSPAGHDSFFEDNVRSGFGSAEDEDGSGDEDEAADDRDEGSGSGQNIAFNRNQWLDLLKWSHHCDALEPEQRMQIVRMGRLIQKGRRLTKKQEEQVLEMVALVQRLGYRIH